MRICSPTESSEPAPDDELLLSVEVGLVEDAIARLPAPDREMLLAHEVRGAGTADLAADHGSTPGAVAAHLNRARARLRIEYLIADHGAGPPTDRCRPVLYALSIADRRRQRELDTSGHLLACDYCLAISGALFERRPPAGNDDEARVLITVDADVVIARQRGREVAGRAGFTGTDLTVIATAISELARNIVKSPGGARSWCVWSSTATAAASVCWPATPGRASSTSPRPCVTGSVPTAAWAWGWAVLAA